MIEINGAIAAQTGVAVLVDYAHTPDAVTRALGVGRELAQHRGGRVVALVGCGGDRDAAKRPMMGEIAARMADVVIITDAEVSVPYKIYGIVTLFSLRRSHLQKSSIVGVDHRVTRGQCDILSDGAEMFFVKYCKEKPDGGTRREKLCFITLRYRT